MFSFISLLLVPLLQSALNNSALSIEDGFIYLASCCRAKFQQAFWLVLSFPVKWHLHYLFDTTKINKQINK